MSNTQERIDQLIEETRESLEFHRGAVRAAEASVERLEDKLGDLHELQRLAAHDAEPKPAPKPKAKRSN